jgi:hypothetical protein
LEIANNCKSFLPVNRNGWWIKFSTYNSHNVLLVVTSMFTGQTFVRHYDDEEKAVNFINYIIECDPALEVPE